MITAPFFAAFNFVANNKWAQIVLTVGLVLIAYKWQAEHHEARGRRQAKARSEAKSRRVQKQVRENLNEKSTQTTDAVDTVRQRIRNNGGLSDKLRERFIRPDGNSDRS